jgi:hypothetical protein
LRRYNSILHICNKLPKNIRFRKRRRNRILKLNKKFKKKYKRSQRRSNKRSLLIMHPRNSLTFMSTALDLNLHWESKNCWKMKLSKLWMKSGLDNKTEI